MVMVTVSLSYSRAVTAPRAAAPAAVASAGTLANALANVGPTSGCGQPRAQPASPPPRPAQTRASVHATAAAPFGPLYGSCRAAGPSGRLELVNHQVKGSRAGTARVTVPARPGSPTLSEGRSSSARTSGGSADAEKRARPRRTRPADRPAAHGEAAEPSLIARAGELGAATRPTREPGRIRLVEPGRIRVGASSRRGGRLPARGTSVAAAPPRRRPARACELAPAPARVWCHGPKPRRRAAGGEHCAGADGPAPPAGSRGVFPGFRSGLHSAGV